MSAKGASDIAMPIVPRTWRMLAPAITTMPSQMRRKIAAEPRSGSAKTSRAGTGGGGAEGALGAEDDDEEEGGEQADVHAGGALGEEAVVDARDRQAEAEADEGEGSRAAGLTPQQVQL